ncbi:unnamed protein product [Camellia sinensis]
MQPFTVSIPLSLSLSLCLKMAESQKNVFAAFWYSIIGRLLCTNSRKEDQKEEKSGVQIFDLQHFDLYSPHQPMSASLAFTTDAMRLLEEEQFLQLNKKEKDPLKPKQPMPAFFIFRNERRAESKCGWEVIEEWNNMTEKQKKPYEKIAKQNMEKYLEEMEAYKQRKEEGSANPKKEEGEMMKIHKQEALELLKKKEKTKENRQKKKKKKIADPNKPKKPASSFLLFRWGQENDILIMVGEAGSRKTTRDSVVMGRSLGSLNLDALAKWVAEECGVELGQKVGYSVRFDDMTSSSTRVKYMTDGFLSREALLDPYLSRYAVIIVDEANERTVHTDVLLGLLKPNNGVMMEKENDAESTGILKQYQGTKFSPLKLIIMSASYDAQIFSEYFGSAKAVHVQGRQFPVDILYTYHPEIDCIDVALITIFQIHLEEGLSDILVFLTGQEEIEYVEKLVQESLRQFLGDNQKLKVLPIFSSLPSEKQIQVFMPPLIGFRKVILAINIVETSVTIPGIKYAIDPGLVKARTYCARIGMKSLIFVPTSKAQALRRSGRVGRERPGKCFCLYPEIEFEKLRDSTIPEITRCNLSNIILQLKALGVDDFFGFDFMEKPSRDDVIKSLEILVLLDAIAEEYKLSNPVGHQMARLPLKPIHSKALILASQFNCLEKMLVTVAMLSVESIFYAPHEKLEEICIHD